MKLKDIPTTLDGRKDFSGVNLADIFGSEREFAAITGASKSQVNKLKKIGVLDDIKIFNGINLKSNLNEYRKYLRLDRRPIFDRRLKNNGYSIFLDILSEVRESDEF